MAETKQDTTQNNKRIAKNTLLLYFRTFITLMISLYTSRVVLNALGVEDFGIYNVVGGVVGMFALLSGSMTAATQRFIACELGKENGDSNHVFSATLTIHLFLALVIVILAETIGLWFLNSKLVIAPERMVAANWVYQCSVFTFVVNIISIPYNGLIIAHERMDAFAVISILEAMLKLVGVISLAFIFYDKLIVYALFMFSVAFTIRFIYGVFCKRAFDDSNYRFFRKSPIYKSMLGFTGWNMLGSSSGILSNQGINILINLFFGVIPNAARGIATQVDNALNAFVSNFTIALNPQITKAYAAGNKDYAMKLVNQGGKFCFYLFLIGALPIIVCAPQILELWLKIVPDYSVLFLRLSLVYILMQTWSQTLYILMLASGDIKKYQLIVGGASLLTLPLTWMCFEMGFSVEYSYYSMIFVSLLCLILRLIVLKEKTGLDSLLYIKNVLCPTIIVVVVISILIYGIVSFDLHWVFNIILVLLVTVGTIYTIGLNRNDKVAMKGMSKSILCKILKR